MELRRSGTVRGLKPNGDFRMGTEGQSRNDIVRYEYDEYDTVRNPYKDEARNIAFLEKKIGYIINGNLNVTREQIPNRLQNSQQAIRLIVVESIAADLRANTRNPPSAYLGRNRVRRGGVEKIVVDCRY